MATRKYRFEKMSQEELIELEKKIPKAVRKVEVRRPVYHIIAQLLNCGVEVPGLKLIGEAPATDIQQATQAAAPAVSDTPAAHEGEAALGTPDAPEETPSFLQREVKP